MTFWEWLDHAYRSMAESAIAVLLFWGGLGGLTSSMVAKSTPRAAVRQIAMGMLIAAGCGSLSVAVVTPWLHLPPGAAPVAGLATSATFLAGVFGPAIFELVMARIKRGQLPGERDPDA